MANEFGLFEYLSVKETHNSECTFRLVHTNPYYYV